MSDKKKNNRKIIAGAAVLAAAVLIYAGSSIMQNKGGGTDRDNNPASGTSTEKESQTAQTVISEDGNIVIKTADIKDEAAFFEYDSNGTTMGIFAVKADDGTIRTALNTCQVCQGSPYAFFEQKGDSFQCQNCGNMFSKDMIEKEKNGCNPIPITSEMKTVTEDEILIPASLLDDNSQLFKNWKKS